MSIVVKQTSIELMLEDLLVESSNSVDQKFVEISLTGISQRACSDKVVIDLFVPWSELAINLYALKFGFQIFIISNE